MKILVTGKGGNAGSWSIRGIQLGCAIGATIKPMATYEECCAADLIVVVKRTPAQLLKAIRKSGKPWIYDIVDGWPQPTSWSKEQAVQWLRDTIDTLKPSGIVYGTEIMKVDAKADIPSLILPHHSWHRYVERPAEIRKTVTTIGYEGMAQYLGDWYEVLVDECTHRGWTFIVNGDMRCADIGIALRDNGGYPSLSWKPGTKLSNLHALGIPALCSPEAGCISVASGEEIWIENKSDVRKAFELLKPYEVRLGISKTMRKAMLPVSGVAEKYKKWLQTFK